MFKRSLLLEFILTGLEETTRLQLHHSEESILGT